MKVFMDDRFIDENAASISIYDHGFLYGDGLFETIVSYCGKLFMAQAHIDRLFRSASLLFIKIGKSGPELLEIMNHLLAVNNVRDAYIRISVTRGVGRPGLSPSLCPKPTIIIHCLELNRAGHRELRKKGVKISIVNTRRNHPLSIPPQVKSMNFINNILAKIEAEQAKCFDGIMLNHNGYLSECSTSNLFFVKSGNLHTPSLETGILNGITRSIVIDLFNNSGGSCNMGLYHPQNLLSAEEAFITNSSLELLPVISVNHKPIGSGKPGPVTKKLHKQYCAFVQASLSYS